MRQKNDQSYYTEKSMISNPVRTIRVVFAIGMSMLLVQAIHAQEIVTPENSMHAETNHYKALAEAPFVNDYPTPEATRTLDEELYFQRAVQTYLWALPAVNMYAMKEGSAKTFGEGYNVLAIFENRLKAHTIITTPNSDVIYGLGFLDLGKDGPMVIDAPPMLQALIDDFWHRPIEGPEIEGVKYAADIGRPGQGQRWHVPGPAAWLRRAGR
jgi:hypothetical protein